VAQYWWHFFSVLGGLGMGKTGGGVGSNQYGPHGQSHIVGVEVPAGATPDLVNQVGSIGSVEIGGIYDEAKGYLSTDNSDAAGGDDDWYHHNGGFDMGASTYGELSVVRADHGWEWSYDEVTENDDEDEDADPTINTPHASGVSGTKEEAVQSAIVAMMVTDGLASPEQLQVLADDHPSEGVRSLASKKLDLMDRKGVGMVTQSAFGDGWD